MTQYILKLSFDLRQVTQSLNYDFYLMNNTAYPVEDSGPLAGTFNFKKDDEIYVEVIATSAANEDPPNVESKDILDSFTVSDCTFVSIPARMTDLLSMFDGASACSTVSTWGEIENVSTWQDKERNMQRLSKRSVNPFKVQTEHGQWKISGYLSVELTPQGQPTFPELYFFDPEGSSGSGGGVN